MPALYFMNSLNSIQGSRFYTGHTSRSRVIEIGLRDENRVGGRTKRASYSMNRSRILAGEVQVALGIKFTVTCLESEMMPCFPVEVSGIPRQTMNLKAFECNNRVMIQVKEPISIRRGGLFNSSSTLFNPRQISVSFLNLTRSPCM